jgi:hypothetical protein
MQTPNEQVRSRRWAAERADGNDRVETWTACLPYSPSAEGSET